jgi:hypothetical protein
MMNPAPGHRFPRRYLPLLVLLLLAGARVSLAAALPVTVVPPTAFKLYLKESMPVRAGTVVTLEVQAVDASGNSTPDYVGQVQFTSTDPLASLPTETSFTTSDAGYKRFSLTFGEVGTWSLTVTDSRDSNLQGTLRDIKVTAGDYAGVALSVTNPVGACSPATLKFQAVDAYGNPVREGVQMVLCAPQDSSVTLQAHTFEWAEQLGSCIRGDFPADTGTAEMTWTSPTAQTVAFTIKEPPNQSEPFPITWGEAGFSPARSTLSFHGTTNEVPELRTFTGLLGLYFEPRDTCGAPIQLPEGQQLAFASSSPLLVFSWPSEEADGRWKAFLQLKQCPADAPEPLSLWPTLDQQPVFLDGSTTKLERMLKPLCLPPDVQLSIRSESEGMKAAPGQLVDFVVEVRNEGQEYLPQGVLGLTASEGLSDFVASLGGQRLEPHWAGFVLPKLDPGAILTVKVSARADARPDSTVRAKAWYGSALGVQVTEKQVLDYEREELGVDVGCGCGAGPLSGQALSLLLLLAVVSRPWTPSRRLGRGERTRD